MARMARRTLTGVAWVLIAGAAHAAAIVQLHVAGGSAQLIVRGRPFLIRGGELGNSSAGTARAAATVLPALARRDFNTVLMPVAWDQIEPRPGRFQFATLDHWIALARIWHLHLVLLWFGSWKNAFSSYAPRWVLHDPRRYPRAVSAAGTRLPILSVFGRATRDADAAAFAALMRHLRRIDSVRGTVLMVQVESEVGYLGVGGRDRSARANRLFDQPVPPRLLRALAAPGRRLPWRLAAHFAPAGRSWSSAFGPRADEMFMAWYYARYIESVAQAGKRQYPLPMYMNAQLPAAHERAGHYPSGGPYPLCQPIYRVAAPAIDFYAPDLYWPDFERWVTRYRRAGNPVFVPESRLELAPYDALYVFGEARGFGFSAFGVDRPLAAPDRAGRALAAVYGALAHLGERFIAAQRSGLTRALILHRHSPRPEQTVALGGYLFRATLARNWRTGVPLARTGAMLVLERRPNVFDLLGSGLAVTVLRNPDTDDRIAGIAGIEALHWRARHWTVAGRLNGDQSNQGRQVLLAAHHVRLYRVRLYSIARLSPPSGRAGPRAAQPARHEAALTAP